MLKIECYGLTALQTKQLIGEEISGSVETFLIRIRSWRARSKAARWISVLGSCMTEAAVPSQRRLWYWLRKLSDRFQTGQLSSMKTNSSSHLFRKS